MLKAPNKKTLMIQLKTNVAFFVKIQVQVIKLKLSQ
jgi:hypothetical protein